MKIRSALALAACFFHAGCGGAFADRAVREAPDRALPAESPAAWEIFRRLDRNGDGALDRAEVDGHWTEIFRILDRRGNGRIALDEFVTWPASRQPFSPLSAELSEPARVAAFHDIDRRRRGVITLDEFLDARDRLFDLLDQRRNGVLRPDDLGLTVRDQAAAIDVESAEPPPPPPSRPATRIAPVEPVNAPPPASSPPAPPPIR